MSTKMERQKKKLAEYDQEHLLRFWEELTDEDRHNLENDIDELDLQEATLYFKKALESSQHIGHGMLDDKVQPIDKKIASAKTSTKEELKIYEALGLKEVAEGRVAVLLMSGGQGTRLGVTYPKGMFDVDLPSHKTLFQLQAERILRLQNIAEQRYGKHGEITWYVVKFWFLLNKYNYHIIYLRSIYRILYSIIISILLSVMEEKYQINLLNDRRKISSKFYFIIID